MAFLLKRFYASIPLTDDGKIIVRCPVDYRNIYSRTTKNYFGNAVKDAVAFFNPEDIEKLSLGAIATEILHAISSVNEESIHKSLNCLDRLCLQNGVDIFESVGCPGLLVSNLSKFPMDKIDIGLGAPKKFFHSSINCLDSL